MTRRSHLAFALVVVLVAAWAAVVRSCDGNAWRGPQDVRPRDAGSPDRRVHSARARSQREDAGVPNDVARATPGGAPATDVLPTPWDRLRSAIAAGDSDASRDAAAAVRALLRADADARRRTERAVGDSALPADLRAALALILGTLPGSPSDDALAALLAGAPPDPAVERAVLLALGARDTGDDDDVFGMGRRPWGADGPDGIGITVKREIESDSVRNLVAARLARDEPEIRLAAGGALRHTLGAEPVRRAFGVALDAEQDDDVAAVLGESLAHWARRADDSEERGALLARVLARTSEPTFDTFRFRIEDDLQDQTLSAQDRARLLRLAEPTQPLGTRSFALTVLATARWADGGGASEARGVLGRTLAADADAAARDLAAQLLGRMTPDDAAVGALAKASRDDAAWNVRHAALHALGRMGARPDVRAALAAGLADADARVSEEARASLAAIDGR